MKRALVVDDSKAMRMIVKRILGELGYECFEAGHGREALERLAEVEGIGLVMADWNMPEMDGLELLRAVRADKRFSAIPVVMVTTESGTAQAAQALAAGASEYIMKPFQKEGVLEKLRLIGVE